ncbi:MAG: SpoVA/SpoVAEb family sporulation membrane protein [Clostridiales bacterium]|nr:SpoVA/SpoVAEb family sporulation membrane protein [Clostridiales bacterium]
MKMTNQEYDKLVGKASPSSPKAKDFIWAFAVGGLICTLGQLLHDLYGMAGMNEEQVKAAVPVTLIFLAALATGLQLFDKLAKHAGAGTLVPITGFANAIVSPAIEFKADERDIIGLSQKSL